MATDALHASAQSFIDFTSSDQYHVPQEQEHLQRPRELQAGDLEALASSAALWKIRKDPTQMIPLQDWTQEEVDKVTKAIYHGADDDPMTFDEWDRDMDSDLAFKYTDPKHDGILAGTLTANAGCTTEKEGDANSRKRKRKSPCARGIKGKPAYLFLGVRKGGVVQWTWRCGAKCAVSREIVRENSPPGEMASMKENIKADYERKLREVVDTRNTEFLLYHMRLVLYLRSHPEERPRKEAEGELPAQDIDVLRARLSDLVRLK